MGAAFMKWTGESMGNGAYYVGAGYFPLLSRPIYRWWYDEKLGTGFRYLLPIYGLGSNFESFNKLLFDALPLYNKFRVPSMAMVVLFFLIPFYGIYG